MKNLIGVPRKHDSAARNITDDGWSNRRKKLSPRKSDYGQRNKEDIITVKTFCAALTSELVALLTDGYEKRRSEVKYYMGRLWKYSYSQVEWMKTFHTSGMDKAIFHFSLKRKDGTKKFFCLMTERARYLISLTCSVLDHSYYRFLRFKLVFLVQEEIQVITFFLRKRTHIF